MRLLWFFLLFLNCNLFLFAEGKNWISIYIWDSFSPMKFDGTLVEMTSSLEILFHQHTNYLIRRALMPFKGSYGDRSTEGHYMFWLHLSDDFLKNHPIQRSAYPDKIFMFKDRESDIFSAWGGEANFRDFILHGVSGLAQPVKLENGKLSGETHDFSVALKQGDADFQGGFYINNQQAQKILDAFRDYEGRYKGYSFLRTTAERPNAPYESKETQAVNGYNCGDFVFHLLDVAGVVPKSLSENLKISFYYPESYWDKPIPLSGTGLKLYNQFRKDPNAISKREDILQAAWFELLFSSLRFFDFKAMVDNTLLNKPKYRHVRIWDQAHTIEYFKEPGKVDFYSKSVVEDLLPYVQTGQKITNPHPENAVKWDYRNSRSAKSYARGYERRHRRNLERAGLLEPGRMDEYITIENSAKKGS